jgi:hypothetical protein
MTRAVRLLARLVVLALVLSPGVRTGAVASPAPAVDTAEAVSGALPEVRIRKLHLVRPDLILYPLFIEVLC